ncbi:MAG: hypothetical protein CL858_17380 [Cupriavidus sp.]|jgi:glycosyltransferase involved in cell wall biosynthesis|nr:hypothetical protein [Cupriavidus sp.]
MMPENEILKIPPDFDATWYLQRYRDVADAGNDPAAHFVDHGRFEGRFPNAQAEADHKLRDAVDATWYLQRYPDVAKAQIDAVEHYVLYGAAQNRFANAAEEADFEFRRHVNPDWYLARYPDVAESGVDPIDHYILYGRAENRAPSPEAESSSAGHGHIPTEEQIGGASPETAVQLAYEIILGRGAIPSEIQHYSHMIEAKQATLRDIVESLFVYKSKMILSPPAEAEKFNDPSRAYLYGRNEFIDLAGWKKRKAAAGALISCSQQQTMVGRFPYIKCSNKPLVSIITSLYKGGNFIENFMKNITGQSIFDECELIIIDADSPEQEHQVIGRYQERFKNIVYKRLNYRIGIYDAWNLGVQHASGRYCTNANLDDCRAFDSLEVQASTLNALSFVDIVYQDIYYSFDPDLPFEDIQALGFKTDLPIVSRYNLLEFNMPHNGPMWRRTLHDDIGMFNNDYKSAADFEFWMRCAIAEKCFYKINRSTVAYYVNPKGLSTNADTRGITEANDTTRRLNRRLISPFLTIKKTDLKEKLEEISGSAIPTTDRYAMVQQALRAVSINSRNKD